MQIGNVKVPCGCDARREIMFAYGNPGITEAIIMALAVLAVAGTTIYHFRQKGGST